MIHNMKCMNMSCLCLNFCVFGKFPEIAWQVTRSRQASHAVCVKSWVPKKEPPGGMTLAARRRMSVTQFLGFGLNCLAMMNYCQATRAVLV